MNRTIVIFVLTCFLLPIYSQAPETINARCFEWSVPVKSDDYELNGANLYWVGFFGNYKNAVDKYSDYRERGDYFTQIYHYENGKYEVIENEYMFNESLPELLTIINNKFKKTFLKYVKNGEECYKDQKFEGYGINSLEIYFSEKNIRFAVTRFGREYNICETVDDYNITFTWQEILPYLKDQTTKTPNYCTPSGPKVNVRSDQSVNASVNFQLDKGQFFEILESGIKDVVNGKDGSWYKINYEGKTGYVFSFYTLCP